jgi:DNA repair protein RecO (recombination protein O)
MTAEKTEAIVVRTVPWSETSSVVTLFTREFGKVTAVAKGARRLKSPFETALDLLAKSHVVFIAKSNDTLDILTEAKLLRRFRSGQRALFPLYCGYYLAELAYVFTENHMRLPGVFEALDESLVNLDEMRDPAKIVLGFEIKFLSQLGHLPTFELCAGCGHFVESSPGGTYLFGAEAGGLLCSSCLPGQRSVLRIRSETVDCFRQAIVGSESKNEDTWNIPTISREEVRIVMERFLCSLVDRRLRLMDFLDDLRR